MDIRSGAVSALIAVSTSKCQPNGYHIVGHDFK